MKTKRNGSFIAVLIVGLAVLLQGCCSNCQRESQTTVKTIFTEAKPVHIIVNTQPYAVTDEALLSLRLFFSDYLGLETEVSYVNLEGVSRSDSSVQDILNAAIPVLKDAQAPTLVLFSVRSIRDFHGGGNCMAGEVTHESGERYPMAVVVLERSLFLRKPIESYLLKHEVGHWIGVPSRKCHVLKNNPGHCSSLRCVMMPGPGSDPLRCCLEAALSMLFLSMPDFCEDCKRELAGMKTLHEEIHHSAKTTPIE